MEATILHYEILVQKDKNGVYIAWWLGETGEGRTQGAGNTMLSAIACLCAVTEQNLDVKANWHKSVTEEPVVIDGAEAC